jgi:hypothetical protein
VETASGLSPLAAPHVRAVDGRSILGGGPHPAGLCAHRFGSRASLFGEDAKILSREAIFLNQCVEAGGELLLAVAD